jgi:hypothetical protein
VGLHDLGDHFVHFGQLLLEGGDLLLEPLLLGAIVALEGGGAALEQLLLPAVEQIRIQLVLIAQIGDRHAFQKVPAKDFEFLLRGELPSCAHSHLPGSPYILTGEPEMSISV